MLPVRQERSSVLLELKWCKASKHTPFIATYDMRIIARSLFGLRDIRLRGPERVPIEFDPSRLIMSSDWKKGARFLENVDRERFEGLAKNDHLSKLLDPAK